MFVNNRRVKDHQVHVHIDLVLVVLLLRAGRRRIGWCRRLRQQGSAEQESG
jgi:hypothetical protein